MIKQFDTHILQYWGLGQQRRGIARKQPLGHTNRGVTDEERIFSPILPPSLADTVKSVCSKEEERKIDHARE